MVPNELKNDSRFCFGNLIPSYLDQSFFVKAVSISLLLRSQLFPQVRDFSVLPIWSGRFGLAISFMSWSFRLRDISVRILNLAEILHVHFLMQTYLNQRKVLFKKTTNMIQDPTVNQYQRMISRSSPSKYKYFKPKTTI